MTAWVLDDRPFGDLAALVAGSAVAWPGELLHLVAEVAHGVRYDRSGRRAALLALTSKEGSACVRVHDLEVGSPADDVLMYLRAGGVAGMPTKDVGEDASIALCAAQLVDGVFVTHDKRAAFIALAELGRGRVTTPFDLWDDLQARALIAQSTFDRLCEATLKGDHSLPGIPRRIRRPRP